ncbi:MAG: NADH-quinone oxidoreductase subunit N [Planctomycetota bacterium]|nr:NADH-quinone oxidoreductase subunit N [Planctomycetota bacterium]
MIANLMIQEAAQTTTALQDQFSEVFTGGATAALMPFTALAVGALLMLLVDIIKGAGQLRPVVVIAALVTSAVCAFGQVGEPAISVLGGTYGVSTVTALFSMIFAIGALFAWVYGIGYYEGKLKEFCGEHDMLLLSAPAGMILMVGAQDLLVFFIGLEILSLPLYALVAFRRGRHDSIEAGLKYFLLGAFAAAFFLFGSALVYTATGTVNLVELASLFQGDVARTPIALIGGALLMAGIFFKVSVFPFHLWVPDVYQGSPTPITTLMATGTKAAAFGFLIPASFLLPPAATGIIAAIALLTMAAGNLGALVQSNVKRMLAYSGIAHAGTVMLVMAAILASGGDDSVRDESMNATLFYMAAYLFTSTGAFGLLAMLEREGEHMITLDGMRGLARRRPAVAAAMTLFMLSLGGIPATGGFMGKFYVFMLLVKQEMIAVAILGALLSVIALGYYLRVIVTMWMEPLAEGERAKVAPQTLPASIVTAACAIGVLALGLMPNLLLDLLG